MINKKNFPALVTMLVSFAMAGCFDGTKSERLPELCSTQWYEYVESVLPTGDGRGHGPDIGFKEWKSVVEFRLGIRDEPGVPDPASPEWCKFIDQQVQARLDG